MTSSGPGLETPMTNSVPPNVPFQVSISEGEPQVIFAWQPLMGHQRSSFGRNLAPSMETFGTKSGGEFGRLIVRRRGSRVSMTGLKGARRHARLGPLREPMAATLLGSYSAVKEGS